MAVEHGLAALARTMAATPSVPIPTFEWATVVAGTGEVHVVLDSDDTAAPRPVSDNAAGPVAVGQRVLVVHHGHRLTIVSTSQPDDRAPTDIPATAAGYTGGITVSRSGRTVTATSTTLTPPSSDWSALVLQLPTWAKPHTTTWAAAVATGNGAVGVAEFAQTDGRMYITAARWSDAPTGVIAFSATWLAMAGS